MTQKGAVLNEAPDTFFTITPADATKLDRCKHLFVGGAGNLVLKGSGPGAASVTLAVPAGAVIPFGAGYVMAATTATGIVALA